MIALRSEARFVGAMGSRRAQASRGASGCSPPGSTEDELGPALRRRSGFDLGAVSGEETALSILPRSSPRGTAGTAAGSQHSRGRIHEVPRDRGLVLAAGAGTRFGRRARSCWRRSRRDRSSSTRSAPSATVAGLERVVVVLGSRADEIRATVGFGRAEPVVCADWADGQAASLRCGVRALAGASTRDRDAR